MPGRPKEFKLTAEECYRRALELDPELITVYEDLFAFHRVRKQEAKAIAVGRKLLERQPEHLQMLTDLSALVLSEGKHAEAVELLRRAMKVNPLDRRLRGLLGTAHAHLARSHAEAGVFEQARTEYQAALALDEPKRRYPIFCKWAACEFKAGDADRAEDLLRQAHADLGQPLPVNYQMVIEAIRLKLKPVVKKRFEKDFADGLVEPPSVPVGLALLDLASSHFAAAVKYTGQKTHEKKVLAYYDKLPLKEFTEAQLVAAGRYLAALKDAKRLKKLADHGARRFARNPRFKLFEVDSYFWPKPKPHHMWRVRSILDDVRHQLPNLPPEEQKEIEAELERREALVLRDSMQFGPPLGMLQDLMGGMGGMFDPGFEDDYDDGW